MPIQTIFSSIRRLRDHWPSFLKPKTLIIQPIVGSLFIFIFFLSMMLVGHVSDVKKGGFITHPAHAAIHAYYVATNGDDRQDGSLKQPWATLNHAAEMAHAGDTIYVKGGLYSLVHSIHPQHSGTSDRPITYAAVPGEHVILDAHQIVVPAPSGKPPFAHDQGAFQIEAVAYIRVRDLEIINSHNAGFTVRNSHHIQLYNNTTNTTFSSGMGLWNGNHYQVVGNTVMNANLARLANYERDPARQTPHEAITLGGVESFEVAYNHVHDSAKEGIDIKETSRHGTVHHNHVHHVDRQGLYVDSWFGALDDVELYHNVVHHCKGGGFMVSAENGDVTSNIHFHHNLIYDNWGTGILLSRWGQDRLRRDIEIDHNTIYHNGFGPPNRGDAFYWITGGLYLFSTHVEKMDIHHNIIAQNAGFQIGYSDRYLQEGQLLFEEAAVREANIDTAPHTNPHSHTASHSNTETTIQTVLKQKKIRINRNLIQGSNQTEKPIYAGWGPDNWANIYGFYETHDIIAPSDHTSQEGYIATVSMASSLFVDAYRNDFHLNPQPNQDYTHLGALSQESSFLNFPCLSGTCPPDTSRTQPSFWWQSPFPPSLNFHDRP